MHQPQNRVTASLGDQGQIGCIFHGRRIQTPELDNVISLCAGLRRNRRQQQLIVLANLRTQLEGVRIQLGIVVTRIDQDWGCAVGAQPLRQLGTDPRLIGKEQPGSTGERVIYRLHQGLRLPLHRIKPLIPDRPRFNSQRRNSARLIPFALGYQLSVLIPQLKVPLIAFHLGGMTPPEARLLRCRIET